MDGQTKTYTPVAIGPTWKRGDDGKFILPKHSLGWSALAWTAQWLQHEDGRPWRYTAEQARFLLWWYAVDERGKFQFRDGVLQRLKGWGLSAKTLLPQLCALLKWLGRAGLAAGMRTATR